jgi:Ca2+-binding RTX toxin-like protein
MNSSNYNNTSANLYALFNFIPFVISNTDDIFQNTSFDINKYTKNNIDERYNLFEKYQALKTPTVSNATLKDLHIYESYKVIYEENSSSAYVIFDEYNKIILTNDSRTASSSAGIGDFSFYGDSFANIETTYLKNNQSALFVNTLKNKVYDTYLDDYIHLNKGSTTLDLSYGSDTVSIDVSAGATIKNVTIKDGGIGDLFIFNGSENSDFIQGTQYNDKIIGGAGDDHLFGGDGNDIIDGGLGNDMLLGENGDDTLIGGDGDDMLMGFGGSNSLNGGDGDDMLNAYNTPTEYHDIRGDTLNGGTGNNTLIGTGYGDRYIYSGGIDTIYEKDKNFGVNYVDKLLFSSNIQSSQVGLYNILNNLVILINGLEKIFVIDYYNNNYSYLDEIHFINPITGYPIIWDTNYILQHTINTADNKVIIGSNNAETINGTEADNYIEGRDGYDIINGGDGNDTIYGGNGNDTIHGNNGDDILYGDEGDDQLYGDAGNDLIYGGNGSDLIYGGIGNDTLHGNAGNDNILGDAGSDLIYGGEGNDVLMGGADNDFIFGDDGVDTIYGDDGHDTIHGGMGNDTITGGNGNDILYGDEGDDIILDGLGNDTLYGGAGNDTLNAGNVRDEVDTIYGGDGNDTINKNTTYTNDIVTGGKGDDAIYGGVGGDIYHYTIGDGNDTITESAGSGSDILYLHDINPNDVDIYRKGVSYTDIHITIKSTGEIILIKNYYQSNSTTSYLDEIIFDNGTSWKKNDIIDKAKIYYGTENRDVISITSYNGLPNTIESGGGNDVITNYIQGTIINSGSGDDNITNMGGNSVSPNNDVVIKSGDGNDTIKSSGSNIVVESGSGTDTITSTMSGTINAGLDNDKIYLGDLKETIIYNIGDGQDTVSTTGAGGDIFNITGYNKIDLNNIFLSGQGKIVELRFNGTDSITLTNYINLLVNIKNSMTFNFDDGLLTSNELKDLYTIINKAETADNTFYDTVFSDQITGTNDGDKINIINGNGGAGFDIVYSGNGVDTITNKIDNTVINAGNDGDNIYTYGKNVTINGDGGDDKIYISSSYTGSGYLSGGEGSDTFTFLNNSSSLNNYIIEGGLGNDTINMSTAVETIIFNKNDGSDTIKISGDNSDTQTDKLIIKGYLKNNITSENFSLSDDGKSVTLKLSETDKITLYGFLSGKVASNNLKYFEFDDGTLTSQELIEKITQIKGTDGNDVIYDTVFNDTIDLSNGGDDQVTLKSGNDTLTTSSNSTMIFVKSSNNIINSGSGSDYLYLERDSINTLNLKSSNNGHDNIGFAYLNTNGIVHVNINKTINIADTSVKGNYYKFSWGNDSSLSFQSSVLNTRIIFNNQIMNLDDINLVGDDGDNYLKAISSKGQTIYGNGGKDTIYGSVNDDIIYGGLGNDMLYGKGGDDKIYGEYGDDRIEDLDGNNFISGGEGNDSIYAGGGNDIIYGGDGNDQLNGGGGIDVIYGGDGNDTISGSGEFYGGNGDDSYHISYGQISDYSGVNSLYFGRHYTAKVDLVSTGNGFNLFINGEHRIAYSGNVNRIESSATPPNGYSYKLSLVGTEINRLFEIEAALENETDTSKITEMNREISNLWKYDQP